MSQEYEVRTLHHGGLLVKKTTIDESGKSYHRTTLNPGDSLDGQPTEVIAAAAIAWTPEVISAWNASH